MKKNKSTFFILIIAIQFVCAILAGSLSAASSQDVVTYMGANGELIQGLRCGTVSPNPEQKAAVRNALEQLRKVRPFFQKGAAKCGGLEKRI
jgi:hypothetical protein